MAAFKWIIFSLFLMLPFGLSASAWSHSSFTVRAGEEVTLSCASVTDDQDKCDGTTWVIRSSGKPVMNFKQGQSDKEGKSNSDRLSVTQKCSLVIKKVTHEDVGAYSCKQNKIRQEQQLAIIYLSVVNMTEHRISDQVTLNCSLSEHGWCRHTVKWLYEGKNVHEGNRDLKSKSNCSVTVTFLTSYLKQSFKCEVTDVSTGAVQQFTFSRQSSGEKTGDAAAATSPTAIKSTPTARNKWTSVEMKNTSGGEKPTFTTNHDGTKQVWVRSIIVSAGLSALIISVVAVNIWTRPKGNKTQTEENTEHDYEDADDGTVIYESIGEPPASFTLH